MKRLVFAGTPEIAVPPLRALHAAGHEIALVVTNPDRRRGRGSSTAPSPVKAAAGELGLPVSHDIDDVIGSGAELGVVVAFGRLIKPPVLAAVPMINLHFSLLPRWRGAAPVERALLAGDDVTGVCVMHVDETLDTGDVYARDTVPIGPATTADELRAALTARGAELLVEVLAGDALPPGEPQVGTPTYADKIRPEEWQLDWTTGATQLHRWVRCGHAWTTFRGKRLGVVAAALADATVADAPLAGVTSAGSRVAVGDAAPGALIDPAAGIVATGDGPLQLLTVHPEGKRPLAWRDFANAPAPPPPNASADVSRPNSSPRMHRSHI